MEDPRVLRRCLVLSMAGEAGTTATFQNSMQFALQDQAVLGSALLPMTVSHEVRIEPQPNVSHDHLHFELVCYSSSVAAGSASNWRQFDPFVIEHPRHPDSTCMDTPAQAA